MTVYSLETTTPGRSIVCLAEATPFLAMLPGDWRLALEASLGEPCCGGHVWVLVEHGDIRVGGALFDYIPLDMQFYARQAQVRAEAGHKYVGYVWVDPMYRGSGWGQRWMNAVIARHPGTPLWLSVEDPALCAFYRHAGFECCDAVQGAEGPEWILSNEHEALRRNLAARLYPDEKSPRWDVGRNVEP